MARKGEKENLDVFIGEDIVCDPKARSEESKLFFGTYVAGGCIFNVMINKDPGLKKETYNVMRKFRHNTSIPHLNFYRDPPNHGRLVIPPVAALFEYWIKNGGKRQLVDENGAMLPLFKTMIMDICDVIVQARIKAIWIKDLDQSNLYMADEAAPMILLLVTEAEKMVREHSNAELFSPVQSIIRWCYGECNVQPNRHAERYIQFICNANFTVKGLKNYPENWDDFTKGEYMLSVIAADRGYIKKAVRGSGLWPKVLPVELRRILEFEREQRATNYSQSSNFDYINLIRDLYKHFDKLPQNIKHSLSGSKEGFIRVVERWTPTIWEDLYDVIGWK